MFVIVFCFSSKERQCTGQHSYRTVTEHTKLITHLRIQMIVRVYKSRSIEQLNSVIRWHQICKNVFHIGSVRCLPRLVCIALKTFHSELQYISNIQPFFFFVSLSFIPRVYAVMLTTHCSTAPAYTSSYSSGASSSSSSLASSRSSSGSDSISNKPECYEYVETIEAYMKNKVPKTIYVMAPPSRRLSDYHPSNVKNCAGRLSIWIWKKPDPGQKHGIHDYTAAKMQLLSAVDLVI